MFGDCDSGTISGRMRDYQRQGLVMGFGGWGSRANPVTLLQRYRLYQPESAGNHFFITILIVLEYKSVTECRLQLIEALALCSIWCTADMLREGDLLVLGRSD